MRKSSLSPSMSLEDFERGYFYASELKAFADGIGIASAGKLRKDELERAIKSFLATGRITPPTPPRVAALAKTGVKDVERGLHLDLPIVNYTSNKETKTFLEREAKRLAPGYKRRSGARYRLNRWREEQLTRGRAITYGDLVREYVRLSASTEPFARIAHGRYINFVADFLANESGATRAAAVRAWKELKRLDVLKDYRSWVTARDARGPRRRASRARSRT